MGACGQDECQKPSLVLLIWATKEIEEEGPERDEIHISPEMQA